VKLLQNWSPEASHLLFFEILLEKRFEKIIWIKFLGDPTFSSSPVLDQQ